MFISVMALFASLNRKSVVLIAKITSTKKCSAERFDELMTVIEVI